MFGMIIREMKMIRLYFSFQNLRRTNDCSLIKPHRLHFKKFNQKAEYIKTQSKPNNWSQKKKSACYIKY